MPADRREAPRQRVPPDVRAEIEGLPVRLVDLTAVGARVEHEGRFALASPHLVITWKGTTVSVRVQVARSEIIGRDASGLLYRTGLQLLERDEAADELIKAILADPQAPPIPTEPVPASPPSPPSLDDSWIRSALFLRREAEDELPYAQYRLHPSGWRKEYVAEPDQPADGFTIARHRQDFHELQRAFEAADPETRTMMQIALRSQLQAG